VAPLVAWLLQAPVRIVTANAAIAVIHPLRRADMLLLDSDVGRDSPDVN
jgi:hypothetical protein